MSGKLFYQMDTDGGGWYEGPTMAFEISCILADSALSHLDKGLNSIQISIPTPYDMLQRWFALSNITPAIQARARETLRATVSNQVRRILKDSFVTCEITLEETDQDSFMLTLNVLPGSPANP